VTSVAKLALDGVAANASNPDALTTAAHETVSASESISGSEKVMPT